MLTFAHTLVETTKQRAKVSKPDSVLVPVVLYTISLSNNCLSATCQGQLQAITFTVSGLPVCYISLGYLHPLLGVLGGIFTPSSST